MFRLILPPSDRRVNVRAFWLTVSLGVTSAAIVAALITNVAHPWLASLLIGVSFASIVLLAENVAARAYRVWNRAVARPAAKVLQGLVLRLCFAIITAAGRSVRHVPAEEGGWRRRVSLPPRSYEDLFFTAESGESRSQYRAWATSSGHTWALCLIPFLTVLRWVDPHEEKAAAANIYTLF